jgi:predicted GIY-YIG superfamily endonuclease
MSAYVYRLYGADDQLLYIGHTNNPARRFGDHVRGAYYPTRGARFARQQVTVYPTLDEAKAAEKCAIFDEQPALNTIYKKRRAA